VRVIREVGELGNVVAESKSLPILVGSIPEHCIEDLIRAKMARRIRDKVLAEHEGQELGSKESALGFVLQLEVERVSRGIWSVLGQAIAKGFEDIARRSDLSSDLGLLVSLCAEPDQLLDEMALRGGFSRSGNTALQ